MRLGAGPHGDVPRSDDSERPVGAALVREESSEPRECRGAVLDVDGRGEVSTDDEVRALAASDLVGDDRLDDGRVVRVGDVEAVVVEGMGVLGSAGRSSAVGRCRCSSTITQRSGAPSS